MQDINRRPPDSMTASERMDEVASLLARGISRLWQPSVAKSAHVDPQNHFELGFSGHQRVHTDPSTARASKST